MSFKFNESLFKDENFNERIKQKLTNLLTKSLVKDGIPKSNSVCYNVSGSFNNNSVVDTTTTINTVTSYNNKVSSNGTTKFADSSASISTNTNSVNRSLNNSNKLSNILKDEIKITKIHFPTIPQVEILDMDITTEPRSLIKAIGNISCSNAFIQLETVVESNLLMTTLQSSPEFITPRLIDNNSFEIPVTMTFSRIKLEAITNVFMRNRGISISFNDVILDFKFDCSIKILQNTLEQKLKNSIYSIFKEVLPTAIFNTSQHWLNPNKFNQSNNKVKNEIRINNNISVLDENDLQDISSENISRLLAIMKSRYTLSLHGTNPLVSNAYPNNFINFNGCLERQNLYRFISTMPSLQNFYHGTLSNNKSYPITNYDGLNTTRLRSIGYNFTKSHHIKGNKIKCIANNEKENYLPQDILDSGNYQLNDIINIQNKLYERNYHNSSHTNNDNNNNIQPKNRIIRLKNFLKSNENEKLKSEKKEDFVTDIGPKFTPIVIEKEKLEPFNTKLSSKTKNINEFVDYLLANPVNNRIRPKRKSEGTLPSATLTKSIGFVGLNSFNSLWGYNNNINNSIIISANDIRRSPTRRLSAYPSLNIPIPKIPPPPPYSY